MYPTFRATGSSPYAISAPAYSGKTAKNRSTNNVTVFDQRGKTNSGLRSMELQSVHQVLKYTREQAQRPGNHRRRKSTAARAALQEFVSRETLHEVDQRIVRQSSGGVK